MSNVYLKAADEARALIGGFAAISTLATAFESVGSLQQAQSEAESALAALQPQIVDAKAQVVQAEATLRAAELEARTLLASAMEEAANLAKYAQEKVDEVQAVLDKRTQNTADLCANMIAAAESEVQSAAVKRDAIYGECEALEARANEARAYIEKLRG